MAPESGSYAPVFLETSGCVGVCVPVCVCDKRGFQKIMKIDIGDGVKAKHGRSEGKKGDCSHSCINSET